jgi:hypothetical protein
MKFKTDEGGWNPYIAGALTGVLAIVSVYLTTIFLGKTNYLGASTTFVRAAAYIEQIFASEHVAQNAYYSATKIRVDWQFIGNNRDFHRIIYFVKNRQKFYTGKNPSNLEGAGSVHL